jgi:putative FmdB family regulatory protein
MPTYEYKCEACGHAFEKFQSMTSAPVRKCPKCGKTKVKRLIGTGAGLIFKGSGFYITDYRSEAYKNSAKGDQPKPAEPAKTGDTKPAETKASDSKPAESKPAESKPAESKQAATSESKSSSSKSKSKGKSRD